MRGEIIHHVIRISHDIWIIIPTPTNDKRNQLKSELGRNRKKLQDSLVGIISMPCGNISQEISHS